MRAYRPAFVTIATALAAFAACRAAAVSQARTSRIVSADDTAKLAHEVDEQLAKHQHAKKLEPKPVIDDAAFLRRVTLDLTGTLPDPAEVTAFMTDSAPDKRARAIDRLLASPAYATHWAAYWDDVLIGPRVRNRALDRGAFRRWLVREMASNAPWNQLVFDLVSATGVNSLGGVDALPGKAQSADVAAREAQAGVNGAVNWFIKYRDARPDLAGATSRVFLGVQIQCAECHDHKTEPWKQTDFRGFAAAFDRTRGFPLDGKMAMKGIRRFDIRDIGHPVRLGKKATPELQAIALTAPRALDGTMLDSPTPRRELAGWLVSPNNPYFAPALVNRYWGALTGRGFYDPVDDIRPSNPPMAPEVLALLAKDFVAHGYDLKRLLRIICLTDAYQRAPGPAIAGGEDFWSRGRLRPLSAEQLLNALLEATQLEPALETRAERQGKSLAQIELQLQRNFTFMFDVDETDAADDAFNGTVQQALMLMNGGMVNGSVRPLPGSTLAEAVMLPVDAARIRLLYLRTLSREPRPDELAMWTGAVNEDARPRAKRLAYQDLFWALLNSSEFQFNH